MKTSNKLIGFGIFACSILAISVMVKAKSSMVDKVDPKQENDIVVELENKLSDEDKQYVERNLGVLPGSVLDLERHHRYILDPSHNNVVVTGPKYIVSDFKDISEEKYFEAPIFHEVTSEKDFRNNSKVFNGIKDTLFYQIGIKDMQSLTLLVGDKTKVTATATIQLQDLKVYMEGNSHMDAEVNCEQLDFTSDGDGHVRIHGSAKEAKFSLEENSNFECYGLSVQDADIVLRDNSRLNLGVQRSLSGIITDNSYYGNTEQIEIRNLVVKNNARIDYK